MDVLHQSKHEQKKTKRSQNIPHRCLPCRFQIASLRIEYKSPSPSPSSFILRCLTQCYIMQNKLPNIFFHFHHIIILIIMDIDIGGADIQASLRGRPRSQDWPRQTRHMMIFVILVGYKTGCPNSCVLNYPASFRLCRTCTDRILSNITHQLLTRMKT